MTDASEAGTGPANAITDVAGISVGHATRREPGWLTGVTVVLPPPAGAVAGVDVRGGGPGTRETDLLDPRNSVQRVHAVVLTGGSAFGLATADGVMRALAADGVGFEAGGTRVPIVPAAVIFDLGRGGSFESRPDADVGAQAYAAARAASVGSPSRPASGVVGAGTGAVAGGLKGGVGTASAVLPDGTTVGALVVVNAAGSTVDPASGELYAARFAVDGEFGPLQTPSPVDVQAAGSGGGAGGPASPGTATTLAVVATDAALPKAVCAKVAGVAHDGMARAIRPVHSMFDGDTVFALATGDPNAQAVPDRMAMHQLLAAAADTVTRAIGHAMLAADTVHTPAGRWRSYRETFPSAFPRVDPGQDAK